MSNFKLCFSPLSYPQISVYFVLNFVILYIFLTHLTGHINFFFFLELQQLKQINLYFKQLAPLSVLEIVEGTYNYSDGQVQSHALAHWLGKFHSYRGSTVSGCVFVTSRKDRGKFSVVYVIAL